MKMLKYLRYIIKHKWYVARACFREGLWWAALTHDLSKFRPGEWFPYLESFYGTGTYTPDKQARLKVNPREVQGAFELAWLKHQHRNPHHWQYWVLENDDGNTVLIPMPKRYWLEMVCDWYGAGWAITGKGGWNETQGWFEKQTSQKFHPDTRGVVTEFLRDRADMESLASHRAKAEGRYS